MACRESKRHSVNQTRATADPAMVHQRSIMKGPIDHLDANRGQEVIDQGIDRLSAKSRSHQGDRLDHDIGMRDEIFVVRITPELDCRVMVGIAPIE